MITTDILTRLYDAIVVARRNGAGGYVLTTMRDIADSVRDGSAKHLVADDWPARLRRLSETKLAWAERYEQCGIGGTSNAAICLAEAVLYAEVGAVLEEIERELEKAAKAA